MPSQILSPVSDELFVNREKLLWKLRWIARETTMPMKHNLCLFGRWRVGKSLLLTKLYDYLFEQQGEVIPIFYSFPRNERWVTEFADHFVRAFAQQYLAFRRNEPPLLECKMELSEWASLAEGSGEAWLADRVAAHQRLTHPVDLTTRISSATELPMDMAKTLPWRFVVMLDEFQRAMEYDHPEGGRWDLRGDFQIPMEWWGVNWIITGSALKTLEERILTDPLNGRFDADTVRALHVRDALELGRRAAAAEGAVLPDRPNAYLADYAGGYPFYISCIARTAAQWTVAQEKTEITADVLTQAAAWEVTEGEIFRQLDFRFQEMFVRRPDQDLGRTLLYRFAEAGEGTFHSQELADGLGVDHEQVVELIDVLALSDLITVGYQQKGRYRIGLPDRILRQFLRTQYERLVAHQEAGIIRARERDQLRREIDDLRRVNGILMKSHLKVLLYTWEQVEEERRTVPGKFFGSEGEIQLPSFEHVSDTAVKLPGERGYQIDVYGLYLDKVGLAAWAMESKFRKGPVQKPEVEQFVRACRALQRAEKLKKVTGWFFSATGFTAPARQYGREQGLLMSDLEQLNGLLEHFGLKRSEREVLGLK